MLVVDANVVAYLVVEGEKTARARELWALDADWCAPRLLFYELANVFSRLVAQGALPLGSATTGLETGVRVVRLLERDPEPARILEIASKLGLSAYGAWYLAVAELMGAPLVTEDRRLLRVAPGVARSLESFLPSSTHPAASL